jgi:hypothetical protein
MNTPVPFRPNYDALNIEQRRSWLRVITAHALAASQRDDPARILKAA